MLRSFFILTLLCFISVQSNGQNVDEVERSSGFEYNGEDKLISDLNFHNKHYGGFSFSPIFEVDEEFDGIGIFIFYEYGYLLMPKNEAFNISLSAAPQLSIVPIGGIALPISGDLNFGSEAGTGTSSVGASLGLGYNSFFYVTGYSEFSTFVRGRVAFENFYGGVQVNTNPDNFFRYFFSAGVKLDL